MMRRAYTVAAIAEEIGKSTSYVEQLIRDSKLPAKKEGRTSLVLAADFEDYLASLPDAG